MNSRTYDQVTDKFLDLSIEKTNSAYMLFYERVKKVNMEPGPSGESCTETATSDSSTSPCKAASTSLSPGNPDLT